MLTRSGLAAAIAALVLCRRRLVVALRGTARAGGRHLGRRWPGRCGVRVCATRARVVRPITAPRVARGDADPRDLPSHQRRSPALAGGGDRRLVRRRRGSRAAAGDRPRRPDRGGRLDPDPPSGRVRSRSAGDRAGRRLRPGHRPTRVATRSAPCSCTPGCTPSPDRTARCTRSRTRPSSGARPPIR